MNALTKTAQDVLAERQRQRDKWGDAHDDEHTNDSLAYGAVSYLLPGQAVMPADWAYKSKAVDRDPRREQLVKGAALALAAVEQYDRWNETEQRRADSEELCEACRDGDEHQHSTPGVQPPQAPSFSIPRDTLEAAAIALEEKAWLDGLCMDPQADEDASVIRAAIATPGATT